MNTGVHEPNKQTSAVYFFPNRTVVSIMDCFVAFICFDISIHHKMVFLCLLAFYLFMWYLKL